MEDELKECQIGNLSSTDLADYLVKNCNVPFRKAHHITGRAVAKAEELECDLSQIELKYLQEIDSRIKADVLPLLSLSSSMNARDSKGGTATVRVCEQIEDIERWLQEA